jgi:hypothetical protein
MKDKPLRAMKHQLASTEEFWGVLMDSRTRRTSIHTAKRHGVEYRCRVAPEESDGFIDDKLEEMAEQAEAMKVRPSDVVMLVGLIAIFTLVFLFGLFAGLVL